MATDSIFWKTQTERLLSRRFSGILKRCYNQRCKAYHLYGGRGIKVCDEWKNDRRKFVGWGLRSGFNPELSIDRINPNGNYCPENCRWVTNKTQANNKRKNIHVVVDEYDFTIGQWSVLLNRQRNLLYHFESMDDLNWYISTHWRRIVKTQPDEAKRRLDLLSAM